MTIKKKKKKIIIIILHVLIFSPNSHTGLLNSLDSISIVHRDIYFCDV